MLAILWPVSWAMACIFIVLRMFFTDQRVRSLNNFNLSHLLLLFMNHAFAVISPNTGSPELPKMSVNDNDTLHFFLVVLLECEE